MSGTHICWIVAGCLTALVKPSLSQSQSITVSVRVYNHANVRHETLERAQSEATRIFQVGLELKWLPDPLSECKTGALDSRYDPPKGGAGHKAS
jgi:hypothetical protein